MSAQSPKPQGRTTLYPFVILVALAGYFVYARVLAPAPVPDVVPLDPLRPVVAVPRVQPAVRAPVAAAAERPRAEMPPWPAGRANPFAALVEPRDLAAGRPAGPVLQAVPQLLPRVAHEDAQVPQVAPQLLATPPAVRLTGTLRRGDALMAIVEIAETTHIVKVGDIVEGLRVIRIDDAAVFLRWRSIEKEVEMAGKSRP
jgi:hypothetical protein